MSSVKKRKWNDSYVGFGFTCLTKRDGIARPQCMLCNLVMSNGNLKPSGLKEHFESKHKDHVGTSIEAFKLKRVCYDQKATLSSYGFSAPRKPLLEASYKVLYMIAREKKPHTIGETLVKHCALEMAKIVLGEHAAKKLSQVSVSNDTVHQRIKDMSQDIITQVVRKIKQSPAKISMQIDESTDVSNHSQLLVFGRDVDIIQAKGKVVAFTRKLHIWCRRVESGNLANFPNLDNILTKDGKTLPVEILQEVKNHLEILSTNFEGYFSDTNDLCMESVWIQNPFSFDVSRLSDNDIAKDDFTEFQEDPRKKADFERAGMDVKQFWCEQISAYLSLTIRAMNVLVPFTTTYLR
ncbi:protein FAM200C-like [Palaemon carinicauda]|uniref:protein FAM200C-like n=1 Tax=Palaemon carinicauda TaxID=392227 RepID=UPI0035B5AB31